MDVCLTPQNAAKQAAAAATQTIAAAQNAAASNKNTAAHQQLVQSCKVRIKAVWDPVSLWLLLFFTFWCVMLIVDFKLLFFSFLFPSCLFYQLFSFSAHLKKPLGDLQSLILKGFCTEPFYWSFYYNYFSVIYWVCGFYLCVCVCVQAVADHIPQLVQGVRGSQAKPEDLSAQLALIIASQNFLQVQQVLL